MNWSKQYHSELYASVWLSSDFSEPPSWKFFTLCWLNWRRISPIQLKQQNLIGMMEGVARNYLKCKKKWFSLNSCKWLIRIATTIFILAMPLSAINCKRLVSKCAWSVWANAHESEAAEDNCLIWRWIETTTSYLAKCTSRWTCKRNFSQDHTSAVSQQTEDLVFNHIPGMDSWITFQFLWIMTLDNMHCLQQNIINQF